MAFSALTSKNKTHNVIIGFDTVNYNLKVMSVIGRNAATAKVTFIPVDKTHFINGDWHNIVYEGLKGYFERESFNTAFAVHLVLPDNVIGTDVFFTPTFAKTKMLASLDTVMKDQYFFFKDYKFNKAIISTNKTNTGFQIVMIAKAVLNSVYKALGDHKLYVKNSTYAANACVNSALALRSKNRKQSFIFLDVSPDSARIIAVNNGVTIGWKQLKFGYNIFAYEKVMIENNVVYNDTAQIAVINATERARKKKMTALEEDDTDDTAFIDENAITSNKISGADTVEDVAEAGASDVDNANPATEAKADGEHSENAALDSAVKAVKAEPVKVKTYQRKYKKLPMYMQRPTPETIEGIRVENFRMFLKHALLMKMQIEQAGIYTAPQYLYVNMPADYAYIIDETNKDNDGFEVRFFDPKKENNVEFSEHLDLFGALFMGQFNKINNV